jgi:hypothetical protein
MLRLVAGLGCNEEPGIAVTATAGGPNWYFKQMPQIIDAPKY